MQLLQGAPILLIHKRFCSNKKLTRLPMPRLPEDESSSSDSGDSLPPLQFVTHGTQQKVEEIGPGAWLKKMG